MEIQQTAKPASPASTVIWALRCRLAAAAPGLALIVFGAVGVFVNRDLPFGDLTEMGAGNFPILVSGLIILFGILTLATDSFWAQVPEKKERAAAARSPWRGVVLITSSTVAYALVLDKIGLFLSGFAFVALACMAEPKFRLREVLLVAAALSAFVVIIFAWGLEITIPVWPVWRFR